MSDNPYVPQNSDTSRQDDRHAIQTTAFRRRRMVTALLHGHSRSDVQRPRHWPFALTGLLATGLVAAGLGVANAYQDQQTVDRSMDPAAPAVPVIVPPEPMVTTPTPTVPDPTSKPATPATKKPPAPTTKKPTQPAKKQPQQTKQQTTKQQTTKQQTTKKEPTKKTAQSSPTKKPIGTSKGGSKQR